LKPLGGFYQASSQQANIEAEMPGAEVDLLLRSGQKVQEQRTKPAVLEDSCYVTVSRAVPAASAAVGKQDNTGGLLRHDQISR
jgi:hypothetical protein